MCFGPDAAVPPPPRAGHRGTVDRIVLDASDGTRIAATRATTTAVDAPGVVVLPDVRGLHPYYESLAEAFADAGVHAIALDLYGRTAGAEWRDADFDYAPHRQAATDAGIALDVQAGLAALGSRRHYVLGFCFGGRAAFLQAGRTDVSGVVGFYGWPAREDNGLSPIGQARDGDVRAPVLALYGGADEKITAEHRRQYDDALTSAGVRHASVTYEGAPHSFFDRRMAEHAEACADAWQRVLRFFDDPADL
jgi:carboxymethylenebutenolidase